MSPTPAMGGLSHEHEEIEKTVYIHDKTPTGQHQKKIDKERKAEVPGYIDQGSGNGTGRDNEGGLKSKTGPKPEIPQLIYPQETGSTVNVPLLLLSGYFSRRFKVLENIS